MPANRPVIVSALVDLERRSVERVPRKRGATELLELMPELLRVALPMVIFTEEDFIDRVSACRRAAAPGVPSLVVPYESHPEWDDDVARLTKWLAKERPLCSSNDIKDTPEYLALGWSKIHCLARAAELVAGDWFWWIDIGISHTSLPPNELHEQIRALSPSIADHHERSHPIRVPQTHLVSLECEGWHAELGNFFRTRHQASSAGRDWWFSGAQLVAGGVFGVANSALEHLAKGFRHVVDEVVNHEAAVTEEMILTRWLVQHPQNVMMHPGGYSDLFTALQPEKRPRLDGLCPSTRFVRLPDPDRIDRAAFNPSILANPDGGFRVVIRHANYRYVSGDYQPLDGTSLIVTDNVLVQLDGDFTVQWSKTINDDQARMDPPLFPVHGLEDMRLFRHGGKWMASATSREHRTDGLCQIVVVEFDDTEPARVISAMRLPTIRHGRHEKNWAPILVESVDPAASMAFLWSTVPPCVVTVDDVLKAVTIDRAPAAELSTVPERGGSQLIPVDGGWLTTVHRAVAGKGLSPRIYEHQIIWYDHNLQIRSSSPWFVFAIEGIEFCAGMAADDRGVVFSFGLEDREAWLAHIGWDDLRSLIGDVAQGVTPHGEI